MRKRKGRFKAAPNDANLPVQKKKRVQIISKCQITNSNTNFAQIDTYYKGFQNWTKQIDMLKKSNNNFLVKKRDVIIGPISKDKKKRG